jgi:hypothetical protein
MTGLRELMDAAEAHGRESEPDMEIGDLQQILHDAWERLTRQQRREVYEANLDILEWGR